MDKKEYEDSWRSLLSSLQEFSESDVVVKYRPIPVDVLRGQDHFAITEESIRFNIDNFEKRGTTKENLTIMEDVITEGEFIRDVENANNEANTKTFSEAECKVRTRNA
mgnify:CR=1 FL=1